MSDESSPLWYRVAALRPRLREHARIHRHSYRGRRWYVLQDRLSGRHYRFAPEVHRLLALMDGARSVQQIHALATEELGERAPPQEQLIELLARLHAGDLLQCDVQPDTRELLGRYERARGDGWQPYLRGPLMIRMPLFDPERLLERCAGLGRAVFSRTALLVWIGLVGLAVLLALVYWPALEAYWQARALAPFNLMRLVLIYPLVKGLHELAHGLAVKRWGGEVHETGIMLLVFMPVPYVDASAASGFVPKHQRMIVGAAGIVTELALSALALLVWFSIETGVLRDIAFNVMLIGSVSTLLFNGNPLLRFDGYYVLADAIEIPNLGQRANAYYAYLLQRYLLGARDARSPVSAPGERGWFVAYGGAAFVYRLVILTGIVLLVGTWFLPAAVVLAMMFVVSLLLRPAMRGAGFVLRSPALRGRRARAITVLAGSSLVAGLALALVPVPSVTRTQGIVWLPEHAQVRAGADGFVTAVLAGENALVQQGELLFESEDPFIAAKVQAAAWAVRELEARHAARFMDDQVAAGILRDQLERARADLAQISAQAESLSVRSASPGRFLVPGARNLPGRFVHKGTVLGFVAGDSRPVVRGVVAQQHLGLVRGQLERVEVRLADAPTRTIVAHVSREVPSATTRLPGRALGTAGGGPITVDGSDPDGLTATERFFMFDIELPPDAAAGRLGTRAYIRFEHGSEPLLTQCYRALRQLLLRRLAV